MGLRLIEFLKMLAFLRYGVPFIAIVDCFIVMKNRRQNLTADDIKFVLHAPYAKKKSTRFVQVGAVRRHVLFPVLHKL